jgi:hypothetical protein
VVEGHHVSALIDRVDTLEAAIYCARHETTAVTRALTASVTRFKAQMATGNANAQASSSVTKSPKASIFGGICRRRIASASRG